MVLTKICKHQNPIKFLTNSIESSLCDYSDVYILVTVNIAVKNANNADLAAPAKVGFKNEADCINIALPMYNLIEYSDNYFDIS